MPADQACYRSTEGQASRRLPALAWCCHVTANRFIAEAFEPRHNSLNFLRLVLATAVIFSHASQLSKPGSENIADKTTIGTVAVYGFFAISGYLIAGSAARTKSVRYLWQRILRILPAFWICLIVIAFAFGLVAWFHGDAGLTAKCGVSCYVRQPRGPFGYIFHNLWLWIDQPGIANTLRGVPLPGIWDGSLWSLSYEFLCYLMLGFLAVVGGLRNRWAVVVLTGVVWISLVTITSVPSLNSQFNFLHNVFWKNLLELVPIFLVGSLLFLYRERIPDSGWLALSSAGLFLAGLLIPLGGKYPAYTLTSVDLTAPFIAYPLIWLGIHLPFQRVGARNDYSYGVYIYGFPVLQLLALWGVARWGYWPYSLLAVTLTVPFAVASWWAIEKHALKLKTIRFRAKVEESEASGMAQSTT